MLPRQGGRADAHLLRRPLPRSRRRRPPTRAGDVDSAMRVWAEMKARSRPTVISYTACVKILFDARRAAEARTVFEEMVPEGLSDLQDYTVLIEHLAL
uniref:Pentacotripeptide-repeat region of PRORP domain-containing protein n=1 Tax=Arundo donax TaxID=35708 RepID=A0A0A9BBP3_ARUDO